MECPICREDYHVTFSFTDFEQDGDVVYATHYYHCENCGAEFSTIEIFKLDDYSVGEISKVGEEENFRLWKNF